MYLYISYRCCRKRSIRVLLSCALTYIDYIFIYFIYILQETINTGPFVMRSTCRMCYGERTVISEKCKQCNGKGKTHKKRDVTVPVPAGKWFSIYSVPTLY